MKVQAALAMLFMASMLAVCNASSSTLTSPNTATPSKEPFDAITVTRTVPNGPIDEPTATHTQSNEPFDAFTLTQETTVTGTQSKEPFDAFTVTRTVPNGPIDEPTATHTQSNEPFDAFTLTQETTVTGTQSNEPFDVLTVTLTADGALPKSAVHRGTRSTMRSMTASLPNGQVPPPNVTPGDMQAAAPAINPAVVAAFLVPSVCGVVAVVALCLWYRLRKQRRHAVMFTHSLNKLEDGQLSGRASDDVSLSISVGTRTSTTSSTSTTLHGMMPFDYYVETGPGGANDNESILSEKKEPISLN